MKIIICLSLIIWTLIGACDKTENTTRTNQPVYNFEFIDAPCSATFLSVEYDEIIIIDNVTYQDFLISIKSIYPEYNCENDQTEAIDFNKFFFVGKKTQGQCSATYDYSFLEDNINKKNTYKISVKYTGNCRVLVTNMNWALIPRLPENYTFEIKVEENQY